MNGLIRIFLVVVFSAGTVWAQDQDQDMFRMGGDVYVGAESARLDAPATGDAFMVGQDVALDAALGGSAHMAGQHVRLGQPVAGNAYLAGQSVTATAAISGNVTALGQTITLDAVTGNLRATGQTVTLNGPLGGAALISGEEVNINAPVGGDMAVNASRLAFGPEASIGGTLTIYAVDPDAVEVPAGVVPADRIVRRTVADWKAEVETTALPVSRRSIWRGFVSSVITVTVLAALLAALMPAGLARMRIAALEHPARALWFGFLTFSAIVGSVLVLGATVIGLLGIPFAIALAVLGAIFGYIVGAYALGVGLLRLIGRDAPTEWIERAIAAGIGAVAIAAIGLVPFVGWLAALALMLGGLGAGVIAFLRPAFFAGPG